MDEQKRATNESMVECGRNDNKKQVEKLEFIIVIMSSCFYVGKDGKKYTSYKYLQVSGYNSTKTKINYSYKIKVK